MSQVAKRPQNQHGTHLIQFNFDKLTVAVSFKPLDQTNNYYAMHPLEAAKTLRMLPYWLRLSVRHLYICVDRFALTFQLSFGQYVVCSSISFLVDPQGNELYILIVCIQQIAAQSCTFEANMFVVYRTFIHVPRWNAAKSCKECFMCFRYHIAQIVLAIYSMACINYSENLAPEFSTAISFISVVKNRGAKIKWRYWRLPANDAHQMPHVR